MAGKSQPLAELRGPLQDLRALSDPRWEFGGRHSGHLVGEIPHELVAGDRVHSYIAPGSDGPMRRTDQAGRACQRILEVHLVDRARQIGGFHEQLLTLR